MTYAQQLQSERAERLARLGMAPVRVVVDRRTIPLTRPISKVDPQIARAILADEIIQHWPNLPAVSGTPVEWNCSLPTSVRSIPLNTKQPEECPLANVTMPEIVNVVAREFKSSPAEIRGPNRNSWVILPRHVAMYLGYRSGLSTNRVARYLGGRDHTTALNGRQKIAARIKADPEFAATVARLEAQLSQ